MPTPRIFTTISVGGELVVLLSCRPPAEVREVQ